MNKKVVIGMSGGVDSSVAAYLLQEQGYEVIGIMMKLSPDNPDYEENEGGCCSISAANDARRVADVLDIPFYVMNFKDVFKKNVIDNFIDEYMEGRTPNPCICLLYTSDAADEEDSVDLGGRRIIKKKT